jgi:hypothetical protein
LGVLARSDPPEALRAWAELIRSAGGPFPLIGAGQRAGTYAALQWNGALLRRAGAPVADGLTLVALASSPPGGTEADLARGVGTGLALAASTEDVEGPTSLVLAAAACAAVTGGASAPEVDELPDLAAALMVVTTPGLTTDLERDLWAGHWLAAGWLTAAVRAAGITGAAATYADTVMALTGIAPDPVDVTVPSTGDGGGSGVPARRLLDALS